MKDLTELSNSELIDWVYTELAGQFIRDNVKDWNKPDQLTAAVEQLEEPLKTTYLIVVLNQQVVNGGFVQYYSNSYGRFAYETLYAYEKINAHKALNLLQKSIELINPDNSAKDDFKNFIINQQYSLDTQSEEKLDRLDSAYYALEEVEDLEQLLSDYLRQKLPLRTTRL